MCGSCARAAKPPPSLSLPLRCGLWTPTSPTTNPATPRLARSSAIEPVPTAYITAYKLIQRLAKRAGIAAAASITPHSLRHTFVTEALAAGVPLQDVQDAAGHADPRTTRRYDRSRHNLDRHPTYVLAAHLRRHDQPEDVAP